MNKKHRILHELWVCYVGGYAGIPQDTRTIFHALSECDAIDLDGLLYLSRISFPFRKKLSAKWNTAAFLNEFNEQSIDKTALSAWQRFQFRAARGVELLNILLKNKFSL